VSQSDNDGPGAAGPVEAAVLADLAGSEGGLAVDTSAEGLRILRGGRGAPDAETVVLLAGRGHAASVWFPCWAGLAARRRLLAIDLPGFGGSPMPVGAARVVGAEDALRAFADPVERCLAAEQARGRAPGGFALVGHSLGGLVALELALRGRLPIRRLAIIDGMGLGPRMTFVSRLFFRLHPERLARWLGAGLFGRINPAPPTPVGRRIAALEYELLTGAASSPARVAAARAFDRLCPWVGPVFHRQAPPGAADGRLPTPALLLWGERDAALPVANAIAARDRWPAATLLTFPTGHSPHLEAPEAILPPLLQFLSSFLVTAVAGG
jgi:pimeloyl-ACP methyl ester carboxylesterase